MTRNIYLALGDSVTAGHGATHPSLTFVNHVSDFARNQSLSDKRIVIAKNGWTTKDVWNAINSVSPNVLEQVNVLTLMTGGNDLRSLLRRQYFSISGAPLSTADVHRRLQTFRFYMDRICGFIARRKFPHTVIATVYNPVPHFPLAVHAMEQLANITTEIAKQYKFPVVDVYEKFQDNEVYFIHGYKFGRIEDLVSPMGRPIHPNNSGHREIATLITAQLKKQLTGTQTIGRSGRSGTRNRPS